MAEKINVTLSPEKVMVAPGERVELIATIKNISEVVEAYSIMVEGVNPAWCTLSVSSISLFPGDQDRVRVTIQPPRTSDCKAGTYDVRVKVVSSRDPSVVTVARLVLEVERRLLFDVNISPKIARGRKGSYRLSITNSGNVPTTYTMSGQDAEEMCRFEFKHDTVVVEPGATVEVPVVVDPKKKPFTGNSKPYSFKITVTPHASEAGEGKIVEGQFECRPLVPKWVLGAAGLALVAVVAVVAVVLTVGRTPSPGITSLDAEQTSLYRGGNTTITCQAAPKSDTLNFTWDKTGGTLSATGNTAVWTAPDELGNYTITVTVDDGEGRKATKSIMVPVVNRVPEIADLLASPESVRYGGSSVITCTASDADGDPLTYAWAASSGACSGNDSSTTWTAPGAAGNCTITVTADDGRGGTAVKSITVEVGANAAPVVSSFAASPTSVPRRGSLAVSCTASDPDGDSITYAWTASCGTISGKGSSITWKAPDTLGNCTITVTVDDGRGKMTTRSVVITVINQSPTITGLAPSKASVRGGGSVTISCVASDADGDTISYAWTQSGGTISGQGSSVTWTAPNALGTYTITVTLDDGQGGTATRSVSVSTQQNSPPSIDSITPAAVSVPRNGSATISCTASDPDGDPLTFTWTATGSTISGNLNSALWTAPGTMGQYTISVTVDDGQGGTAKKDVNAQVIDRPPVVSFPGLVLFDVHGATSISCSASDPDGDTIHYNWSCTGGTVSPKTGSSSVTWTPPTSAGTYTITVTVDDGLGLQATASTSRRYTPLVPPLVPLPTFHVVFP